MLCFGIFGLNGIREIAFLEMFSGGLMLLVAMLMTNRTHRDWKQYLKDQKEEQAKKAAWDASHPEGSA